MDRPTFAFPPLMTSIDMTLMLPAGMALSHGSSCRAYSPLGRERGRADGAKQTDKQGKTDKTDKTDR